MILMGITMSRSGACVSVFGHKQSDFCQFCDVAKVVMTCMKI
jgi:hypothetical protein